MELELASKDYARVLYHIDKNTRNEKNDKIDYEALYKDITKKLEEALGIKIVSKKEDIEFSKKLDEQDEKLIWKLKLMQETRHKEELDEEEDKEDWDDKD